MSKPKLTVIQGGLASTIETKQKHFMSAYVTDTRLMGVLAVYAHFKLISGSSESDLHQFFYIDCEEAGLETYKSITDNNLNEVMLAEQALVGGLGAQKKELTLHQLKGLLCHYADFNIKNKLPFPDKRAEYSFLLEPETLLTKSESDSLMHYICGDITSDYQAVNYFLMRCFGRDYPGASYLAAADVPLNVYDSYKQTTFCKNTIDKESVYDDGAVAYLCESLVERKGNYEIVVSRVVVKDLKIVSFRHCSGFKVSTAEAAMMLAKAEFVTVYEVLLSDEDMNNNIGELTLNLDSVMSVHENGRMFMAFKKNNDHVNARIFRLSNDVKGVYFLTDFGQLIVAAYSLSDIKFLEKKLKNSPLAPFLMTTAKYEFKEPVLFEFIQSGMEDFDEFLDFIKE